MIWLLVACESEELPYEPTGGIVTDVPVGVLTIPEADAVAPDVWAPRKCLDASAMDALGAEVDAAVANDYRELAEQLLTEAGCDYESTRYCALARSRIEAEGGSTGSVWWEAMIVCDGDADVALIERYASDALIRDYYSRNWPQGRWSERFATEARAAAASRDVTGLAALLQRIDGFDPRKAQELMRELWRTTDPDVHAALVEPASRFLGLADLWRGDCQQLRYTCSTNQLPVLNENPGWFVGDMRVHPTRVVALHPDDLEVVKTGLLRCIDDYSSSLDPWMVRRCAQDLARLDRPAAAERVRTLDVEEPLYADLRRTLAAWPSGEAFVAHLRSLGVVADDAVFDELPVLIEATARSGGRAVVADEAGPTLVAAAGLVPELDGLWVEPRGTRLLVHAQGRRWWLDGVSDFDAVGQASAFDRVLSDVGSTDGAIPVDGMILVIPRSSIAQGRAEGWLAPELP